MLLMMMTNAILANVVLKIIILVKKLVLAMIKVLGTTVK
jgi:hypothetical protein